MTDKRKVNLSPEERERRRKRMLELRKKLQERDAETKTAKPKTKNEVVKPERPVKKKPKKPDPIESESESDVSISESESEEEVIVKQPKKKTQYNPKPKTPKPKPKGKAPVLKKVSIKYYSDVSEEQMEKDKMFINSMEGLTTTKQKKATRKQVKIDEEPNDSENKEDVKPKVEPTKKVEQPSNPHSDLLKSLGYSL